MIVAFDREAFLHDDLFRATLEELMIGMLAAGRLVDKGSWRSRVYGRRLNSKKLKYIDST